MRNLIGKATPKEYAELNASLIAALLRFVSTIGARFAPLQSIGRLNLAVPPNHIFLELAHQTFSVSRIGLFPGLLALEKKRAFANCRSALSGSST